MDIFKLLEVVFKNEIVMHVLKSIIIIIIALIVWKIFKKSYNRHISKKLNVEKLENSVGKVSTLFYDVIRIVIILFVTLTILQINGVNVTSLFAGLGIASAVIGLALQDFLKDVIMGIHIVTDNFFSLGDTIKYNDHIGIVVSYNLRTTKIKDLKDESILTICNRNISEVAIVSTAIDLNIGLPYETDNNKVKKVLEEACKEIKENPGFIDASFRGIQDFDTSALVYRVRIECEPDKQFPQRRAGLGIIYKHLKKNNIEIPFNQLDIHMDK